MRVDYLCNNPLFAHFCSGTAWEPLWIWAGHVRRLQEPRPALGEGSPRWPRVRSANAQLQILQSQLQLQGHQGRRGLAPLGGNLFFRSLGFLIWWAGGRDDLNRNLFPINNKTFSIQYMGMHILGSTLVRSVQRKRFIFCIMFRQWWIVISETF